MLRPGKRGESLMVTLSINTNTRERKEKRTMDGWTLRERITGARASGRLDPSISRSTGSQSQSQPQSPDLDPDLAMPVLQNITERLSIFQWPPLHGHSEGGFVLGAESTSHRALPEDHLPEVFVDADDAFVLLRGAKGDDAEFGRGSGRRRGSGVCGVVVFNCCCCRWGWWGT
jgi:hypothetical protein